MRHDSARPSADPGQRRAALKQKRSHATQRSLVHAAVALWRTNGYASTTVADICRAAGVSKSLFFFYFPRKEDLLAEMGVISTQTAHRVAHELLEHDSPYEIADVVGAVLRSLEQQIQRNPPDLIVEIILEGYRQEHRILVTGQLRDDAPYMFTELFERARADGKLPDRRRHLASGGAGSISRHRGCAPLGRGRLRRQVAGRCRRRRHRASRRRVQCTVSTRDR